MSKTPSRLVDKIQRDTNSGRALYPEEYGQLRTEDITSELDKLKTQEHAKSKLERETNKMYHRVNKFTDMIRRKYGSRSYSFTKILKKARKHMEEHGLSDRDFHLFKVLYEQKLINPRSKLIIEGKSEIGKLLGGIIPYTVGKGQLKNLDAEDTRALLEIINLAERSKHHHARSVVQNQLYRDCAPNVLIASFDNRVHNPHCFVHPVLVAMFFPKIEVFEDRMLNSFLAGVIKDRKTGAPLRYRPDYELFVDITTDKNDLVCSNKSVMTDLLSRVHVQESLRRIIHNMRSGRLFECDGDSFLTAIDRCRSTPFDNPHLLYVKDEGTILRRLLNIFSFRPTHVITSSVYNVNSSMAVPTASSINQLSMIEVKLPFPGSITAGQPTKHLMAGLSEPQIFIENGVMVPKRQQIIFNREAVIFYVNRRYQSIPHINNAYVFQRLPLTIGGHEKINTFPVDFRLVERIAGEYYYLRSVVIVDVDPCNPDVIIGSSALIVKHDEFVNEDRHLLAKKNDARFFIYKPSVCSMVFDKTNLAQDLADGNLVRNSRPFFKLPATPQDAVAEGVLDNHDVLEDNFSTLASNYGTVFIYTKRPFECGKNKLCSY